MGTGTDVAMESAAVTLVKGDLRGIARARRLSRTTSAAIRQNLFLAFVYNGLSVPLAAFGYISPMWASAAMSLSSVSVILNSLRFTSSQPVSDCHPNGDKHVSTPHGRLLIFHFRSRLETGRLFYVRTNLVRIRR